MPEGGKDKQVLFIFLFAGFAGRFLGGYLSGTGERNAA